MSTPKAPLAPVSNMDALGHLAAGIAHEINTPAQYVSDNIFFLQDAFDDLLKVMTRYRELYQSVKAGTVKAKTVRDLENEIENADLAYMMEQIPEAIGQSLDGMTRIIQIVEAVRDFSHPGLMEKKAVDINKAIRNTVTVTRNIWKRVAQMDLALDDTLPHVPCRPADINQVILNLITNAADAIADSTADAPGATGTIRIQTSWHDPWVEIRISDTGPGIPDEVQDKIFDPFFTTKPVGKGTGQGLAISASVMANHGGSIRFETHPGSGTTFILQLPLKTPET